METNEEVELEVITEHKQIFFYSPELLVPPLLKRNLSKRDFLILLIAILLSIVSCLLGLGLLFLINFLINLCFYGHVSIARATAANNHLGVWVIPIPVIGGVIVGMMARWGSPGVRGHGIPEAMASVLHNSAKIPPKILILKPISAAISIGTGGPFGAEGPIIATGAALGSLFGQVVETTKRERVTFVAVGASAGMTAIFNSPLSAVFVAFELLLNEYNPFSLICVSLGVSISYMIRAGIISEPIFFEVSEIEFLSLRGMFVYSLIGIASGFVSVFLSKLLYSLEHIWEKSRIPNIAQPGITIPELHSIQAIGALFVGIIGYFFPRTLSVGYDNITDILSNKLSTTQVLVIFLAKGSSWILSLSSGTSGGTLTPLFTLGSALGALISLILKPVIPGVDVATASITGMSATFAGCSRALLMSVAISVETTQQIRALPAVVLASVISYFISVSVMKYSMMTEKMNREGQPVVKEIVVDFHQITFVKQVMIPASKLSQIYVNEGKELKELVLNASESQNFFPIVGMNGALLGIVSREEILALSKEKVFLEDIKWQNESAVPALFLKNTLGQALDHMILNNTKCLPVVFRKKPNILAGILSKKDIKMYHKKLLEEMKVSSAPKIQKTVLRDLIPRLQK